MNERRREFAILRSLGARRSTVFSVIVLEAATIAGLGSLLGGLVYFGLLALAAQLVRQQTGVALELYAWHPALVATPLGMILLGALAGLLPAWKAYSTDVALTLARS
jgi:putative ABC transport system permease protein